MRKFFALAAVPAAALALSLAGTAAASAGVVPNVTLAPVYNSNAEAGMYVQSGGSLHFRDVRSSWLTTQAQEAVNQGGTLTGQGGVGDQLCSNSSGDAVQFGLVPTSPGIFTLEYQQGILAQHVPASTADACATGGVLSNGITVPFASYQTVPVGDTISTEIYYNQTTGWVTLAATDLAQGGQEEFHFHVLCGKFCFFTEPGVGARDLLAPSLTAPADIALVNFTGVRATQYNGVHHGLAGAWDVVSDNYNVGGSATDAPADLLTASGLSADGSQFTIWTANPGT